MFGGRRKQLRINADPFAATQADDVAGQRCMRANLNLGAAGASKGCQHQLLGHQLLDRRYRRPDPR
jgi:hypothetical protein